MDLGRRGKFWRITSNQGELFRIRENYFKSGRIISIETEGEGERVGGEGERAEGIGQEEKTGGEVGRYFYYSRDVHKGENKGER